MLSYPKARRAWVFDILHHTPRRLSGPVAPPEGGLGRDCGIGQIFFAGNAGLSPLQSCKGALRRAVRLAEPVQKQTVRIWRITVWKCSTTASVETVAAANTPAA